MGLSPDASQAPGFSMAARAVGHLALPGPNVALRVGEAFWPEESLYRLEAERDRMRYAAAGDYSR